VIQVKGNLDQNLVFPLEPELLLPSMDRQFAEAAKERIQKKEATGCLMV
jgi:hypothetical protein